MSLLSRLFKPKTNSGGVGSPRELAEAVGLLLLAARERRDDSLRHSARLGDLLGLLWQEDAQALNTVYEAFSSVERLDREFLESLAGRIRAARPALPPTPEERYKAVVDALQAEIEAVPLQSGPLPDRIILPEEAARLNNALILARILLPPELHQSICAFLVANNRACRSLPNNEMDLPYQRLIRDNIYRYLASLSPDSMPHFWAMVRDEAVSEEFWSGLTRIRDRKAVPYLLELLPLPEDEASLGVMSLDGQKNVIKVLREIGDVRAVPALLAIEKRKPLTSPLQGGLETPWHRAFSQEWRERSALAQIAGEAARHIVRTSGESGAPLLRPPNGSVQSDDTLLRPSSPGAATTAPGERMRPADASEKTDQAR